MMFDVDPFEKPPIEKLFEASANIEYVGRIIKENKPEVKLHGVTIHLESLSFWTRLNLLIFGSLPSMKLCEEATKIIETANKSESKVSLVKLIIASLKFESNKWEKTYYTLKHSNGLEVWTSSGKDDVGIWNGTNLDRSIFSIDERRKIWKAYKEWDKSIETKRIEIHRETVIKKFSGSVAEKMAPSIKL